MYKHRTIIALVLCLTIVGVQAYSGGAPEGACDSLMPSHNAPQQDGIAPYKITPSKTSVGAGQQIEVNLSGTAPFKGFFLRAWQNNAFIDGTFQENNFGSLRCGGTGITHSNPSPKNNINIMWTAPANLQPLPVAFVATFVQEKIMFWTKVKSEDVAVIASPPAGGNANNNAVPTTGNSGNQVTSGSSSPVQPGSSNNINSGGKNSGNGVEVGAGLMTICFIFLNFHFFK